MEKSFSFLSKEYDRLFLKNLEMFCKNISKKESYQNRKFSLFYPSFGTNDKKIDFVIYGQATKGWTPEFEIDKKINYKKLVDEARIFSNTIGEIERNPLDWVNINWSEKTKKEYNKHKNLIIDYNANRSFFWNVTYKLISDYYDELDRNSPDWSDKLVWSNLMKIAPTERLNPDEVIYSDQLQGCVNLFIQELEEIKPKYAILLTNLNWAKEFIKTITGIPIPSNDIIEWAGYFKKTLIIITKRPFQGNSDKFVEAILKFISLQLTFGPINEV